MISLRPESPRNHGAERPRRGMDVRAGVVGLETSKNHGSGWGQKDDWRLFGAPNCWLSRPASFGSRSFLGFFGFHSMAA